MPATEVLQSKDHGQQQNQWQPGGAQQPLSCKLLAGTDLSQVLQKHGVRIAIQRPPLMTLPKAGVHDEGILHENEIPEAGKHLQEMEPEKRQAQEELEDTDDDGEEDEVEEELDIQSDSKDDLEQKDQKAAGSDVPKVFKPRRRARASSLVDPVTLAQRRVQEQIAARRRTRLEERRQKAMGNVRYDAINIEAFRHITQARLKGNAKDLPSLRSSSPPAATREETTDRGEREVLLANSVSKTIVPASKAQNRRRRIAIVGGGPVGLWAANLIMLRHARRVRKQAAGSGAAAVKSSGFIRGPDAPEIVVFERRVPEEHCTRRNVRITLDMHTVALLNKHTKSKRFVSGMALAEIETTLLEQWRRLGGPKGIRYGSQINSPGEIAEQEDWDLVLWAGGRWSLDDATRASLSCNIQLGDHEEVLVFELRDFMPVKRAGGDIRPPHLEELDKLAATDLTYSARHSALNACPADSEPASTAVGYRIVLRVAQDADSVKDGSPQPLCWLWFMGLPPELKAAKNACGPSSKTDGSKRHDSLVAALAGELARLGLIEPETADMNSPSSSTARVPWIQRVLAAAGALDERVMSPGSVSARWVDASFWSADRVVCPLPAGPSGRHAPLVVLGDAAMGKPFYMGTTLNVHLAEVKAFSQLPVIRWGQVDRSSPSEFDGARPSRFVLDAEQLSVAPYQAYEDRYRQLLTRTPGFQRREGK